MNFEQSPEFKKDLKHLKKWRTLVADVKNTHKIIELLYLRNKDSNIEDIDFNRFRQSYFSSNKAAILTAKPNLGEVVKMRVDVADQSAKNMVRLVYIYFKQSDTILFIELFAKNNKNREDPKRIKYYFK